MNNIRIMLTGESAQARSILSTYEAVRLVADVNDAEFILQDAESYRSGRCNPRDMAHHDLTPRELEVLRMTAEGYSVRQVAAMLQLSAKTVDAHKVNLMRKLQIHNKAHLVQYAFRHRILSLDTLNQNDTAPKGLFEMPTAATHC